MYKYGRQISRIAQVAIIDLRMHMYIYFTAFHLMSVVPYLGLLMLFGCGTVIDELAPRECH